MSRQVEVDPFGTTESSMLRTSQVLPQEPYSNEDLSRASCLNAACQGLDHAGEERRFVKYFNSQILRDILEQSSPAATDNT
jgi:hypothetical protein